MSNRQHKIYRCREPTKPQGKGIFWGFKYLSFNLLLELKSEPVNYILQVGEILNFLARYHMIPYTISPPFFRHPRDAIMSHISGNAVKNVWIFLADPRYI